MQLKLKYPTESTYLFVTVIRMDDAQYAKIAIGGEFVMDERALPAGTFGSSSDFLSG